MTTTTSRTPSEPPLPDARSLSPRAQVFASLPLGLAIVDTLGTVRDVNPAAARMMRMDEAELVGRPIGELLNGTLPQNCGEALRRREQEFLLEPADGPCRWLRAEFAPIEEAREPYAGFIVQLSDITEARQRDEQRRTLEDQLRRSQRMEAVGRLAGGIAHDFNNMLSIILNYAEFARRVSPDGRSRDYLDAIRKGALRAAALTRQLLIFGRRDTTKPESVDLNQIVSEMERLLRRTLGEDVELTTGLAPALARVRIAIPHAEQVVMNLAVNARDAMPRGGRLRLSTHNLPPGEPTEFEKPLPKVVSERSRTWVCLTVADTGVGMTDEVLSLAFDPFFTTKQPGEGTGLGLSIVYGIVQEAGGVIDVQTAPGEGTELNVYFPASEFDVEEPLAPAIAVPLGQGETVLVVEDEPTVRALTVQILRESGYHVTEAEGPESAIELCRKRDKPFDVLLTDVIMPRMSGTDLAICVTALWRETRVLFMSGYAADRLDQYRHDHEDVVLLQKPFNGDDLLYALRRLIDDEED